MLLELATMVLGVLLSFFALSLPYGINFDSFLTGHLCHMKIALGEEILEF